MEVQTRSYCNYPEHQRRSKDQKHLRRRDFQLFLQSFPYYMLVEAQSEVKPGPKTSKMENFLSIANGFLAMESWRMENGVLAMPLNTVGPLFSAITIKPYMRHGDIILKRSNN